MDGLLFIGMLIICGVFGFALVQPVASAAKGHASSKSFVLSDLLSLSISLCLPLVFYSSIRRHYQSDAGYRDFLAIILCLAFVYLRWRGSRTLSSIGVVNTQRRVTYLVVIIPLAILGSLFAMPMWLTLTMNLGNLPSRSWLLKWFGLTIGLPVGGIVVRRMAVWVVAKNPG